MIHKQDVLVAIVALFGLMLLASAPASAGGRPCPVDHGACFDFVEEGVIFGLFEGLEDGDNDGDVDYMFALLDGVNDFLIVLPDGRLRYHLINKEVPLLYCPLPGNLPPDDSCVEGVGRASGNGVLGGPQGACPGRFKMSGTGERISDGAVFRLTADFQVAASDCEGVIKFFITAEQVD